MWGSVKNWVGSAVDWVGDTAGDVADFVTDIGNRTIDAGRQYNREVLDRAQSGQEDLSSARDNVREAGTTELLFKLKENPLLLVGIGVVIYLLLKN